MITVPVKGIPVILLPLCSASLAHKNPQGRKIIQGTHPAGCKEWSFDRSIYVWLKPEIKPTSAQIKRTIWPVYIIGQEVISERINRSISMQIFLFQSCHFDLPDGVVTHYVYRGFKTSRRPLEFRRLLDCMSPATLVRTVCSWQTISALLLILKTA